MKNVSLFATFFFEEIYSKGIPYCGSIKYQQMAVLNIIRNKHASFLSVLKSSAVPKMFQNVDYKH
jgi:hypothetical protein